MRYETDLASALAETRSAVPLLLRWSEQRSFRESPEVHHFWHPPARTFVYHTVSALEGADKNTLEDMAFVLGNANRLASQPWYPAFLSGSSQPLQTKLPEEFQAAATGQASFDFGLGKPRYYNQLMTVVAPQADTRIVALRSINGMPPLENSVKAYTLDPTADVLRLKGERLEWHHIVTVGGPALLPPGLDRVFMNTLRRMKLDRAERRTYMNEAIGIRAMQGSDWRGLREQLQTR